MTKKEFFENAKQGLVNGIFWSIGASIGFAIVTTILVSLMSRAGTLPLLGNFIASIVRSTLQSLGVEVPVS